MNEHFNEDRVKNWFRKYSWHSNPFTFKIYPEIVVGYKDQIEDILNAINVNSTFSLVIGKTGAGKTNLMRWIATQSSYKNSTYYLPKPPTTTEELFEYLKKEILKPSFFARKFTNISMYNIHQRLQKKFKNRALLIIDEAHEASLDVLKWIRTALDHVPNLVVVAAGLPSLVTILRTEVNTLYDRATTIVELKSLGKDESLELIQKRIFAAGGRNLEPFTSEALMEIYEKSSGFPRDLLRLCNNTILYSIKNNKFLIDRQCVLEYINQNKTQISENKSIDLDHTELTDKQKLVIDLMLKLGKVDPNTIVQNINLQDYKSEGHAIRSVNNILKRLRQNNLIDREKKGRTYLYFIRSDAKKILL